jgi:hypothetical protein
MTKQRTNYLYKFFGTIQKKYRQKRAKNPQYFYQLKVKLETSQLTKIFAFKNKTTPSVWNSLESDSYIGQKYLFHCRNYQGSYYLVDWEEINA